MYLKSCLICVTLLTTLGELARYTVSMFKVAWRGIVPVSVTQHPRGQLLCIDIYLSLRDIYLFLLAKKSMLNLSIHILNYHECFTILCMVNMYIDLFLVQNLLYESLMSVRLYRNTSIYLFTS